VIKQNTISFFLNYLMPYPMYRGRKAMRLKGDINSASSKDSGKAGEKH